MIIYSQPELWRKATESLTNYDLFDTKTQINLAIRTAPIETLQALAERSNHFNEEVIKLAEKHITGSSKKERNLFWNTYIHNFPGKRNIYEYIEDITWSSHIVGFEKIDLACQRMFTLEEAA